MTYARTTKRKVAMVLRPFVILTTLFVGSCGSEGVTSADRSGFCTPLRELARWTNSNPRWTGTEADEELRLLSIEAQAQLAGAYDAMSDFAPSDGIRSILRVQAKHARMVVETLEGESWVGGGVIMEHGLPLSDMEKQQWSDLQIQVRSLCGMDHPAVEPMALYREE